MHIAHIILYARDRVRSAEAAYTSGYPGNSAMILGGLKSFLNSELARLTFEVKAAYPEPVQRESFDSDNRAS